MRAVRGMVGLVIVTLIGSAAFVAHPTTKAGATAGTVAVRRGDTLSAIASRAGTTVAALAALNGIRNPDHVEVGQVLKLPAASGSAPVAATTSYVVVVPMLIVIIPRIQRFVMRQAGLPAR